MLEETEKEEAKDADEDRGRKEEEDSLVTQWMDALFAMKISPY